jgi:endonuclease/exonuclease/phosphatase family metal-dependent hydrolase
MHTKIKKYSLIILLSIISLHGFSQREIKVMSYNIRLDVASDGENRWDARKDKVAGLMNYYEADFIGSQEVQHHQLQYLLSQLKDYSYIGVGRDDAKEAGEYSCIFYKKDKYAVLQQSTFWLSPTPHAVSIGWDAAYKRVCTYGLFKDNKTKKKFWVFNTHLDHVGPMAKLEGVKLILEKIKELNTKNYPVILTGDFNSHPDDAPIQAATAVLQNTRSISNEVYGPADTWNAFKFHEKLNGCIDYVFINKHPKLTVSKFATITDSYDLKYPSDHLPVLATIQMKKK